LSGYVGYLNSNKQTTSVMLSRTPRKYERPQPRDIRPTPTASSSNAKVINHVAIVNSPRFKAVHRSVDSNDARTVHELPSLRSAISNAAGDWKTHEEVDPTTRSTEKLSIIVHGVDWEKLPIQYLVYEDQQFIISESMYNVSEVLDVLKYLSANMNKNKLTKLGFIDDKFEGIIKDNRLSNRTPTRAVYNVFHDSGCLVLLEVMSFRGLHIVNFAGITRKTLLR
jgi:hypothetical protein